MSSCPGCGEHGGGVLYELEGVAHCWPCFQSKCPPSPAPPPRVRFLGKPTKRLAPPTRADGGQENNLDAAEGLDRPPTLATSEIFDALNHFAFLTPHCWPSEAALAEWAGYDRRTVVRAKAWLRDHGWISWERAWHPGSRWQHCRYEILAGWHRPLRKTVLKWLEKRRCRANVPLSELPRPRKEKETQRSKGRKVRNPWSRPWEGWRRSKPPPKPADVELIVISADFAARAGGRERAEAFATWTPYALAA